MEIQVRGRLIDDSSAQRLAGVCVSNGERIVRTNDEGEYELDVEPGAHRFVFITLPDGFQARDGVLSFHVRVVGIARRGGFSAFTVPRTFREFVHARADYRYAHRHRRRHTHLRARAF